VKSDSDFADGAFTSNGGLRLILTKYYDCLSVRNYQPATLKKNVRLASKFAYWLDCELSEMTSANVEDYLIHLHQQGRSAKTIKNHRSAIKVFCDFLGTRGILQDNPVLRVPSMELPEEIPIFLTDEEVDKLMVIARLDDMFCEVTLALNTGLRMEEMRRLEWRDIDLKFKQLTVRKSKSKRPRTVPLNQRTCKALETQRERYGHLVYVFPGGKGGFYNRGIWTEPKMRSENWWQKLSIRHMQEVIPSLKNLPAGRTGRGWHALRHTFATRAVRANIDMFKLKDWMGHKKIETTMCYVHVSRNYDEDIELL
tara:strand:+ start:107779 stop:108711 length:933 start_codon:yes stop_codon:yes gene_type:complete